MPWKSKQHERVTGDGDVSERYRDTWAPYKSIRSPETEARLSSLWDHRYDKDYGDKKDD